MSLTLGACGGRISSEGQEEATAAPPVAQPKGSRPQPHFACAPSTERRPMLAARIDDAVHFVYPDRSVRRVFDLSIPGDGHVVGAGVTARGDRVAAYAIITPLGKSNSFAPFVEIVVLDLDGAVRFTEQHPFGYEGWGSDSVLVGHENGRFVLTLREIKVSLGLVIDDGGSRPFDGEWAARSDPDARGRLIVNDYRGSGSVDFHWLDASTGQVRPTTYWTTSGEGTTSSAAIVDDGVAYFARAPNRLVWERADNTVELPVGDVLAADDYPGSDSQHSGGWVLFSMRDFAPRRYVVTHPATRTLRELSLTYPPGWQGPTDTWSPPIVDGTGRVVQILANGERRQVFATSDGSAWAPLGLPITQNGYPATLIEAGGALVFDGFGNGSKPAAGALPSHAAQFVGPQGGKGTVLERWGGPGAGSNPSHSNDALSGDGRCLAHFRGGAVRVVESTDYAVSDLPLTATTQRAELAWIPLSE
jgi:hypothetical protein